MAFLNKLNTQLKTFIQQQHLFFVATAAKNGRINVSPKGLDSLRILDDKTVLWLNYTGSGNESAAQIREANRMTIMFCSFTEKPLILRLYGTVDVYHRQDQEWDELISNFNTFEGARNLFVVNLESVQTSCGYGVPFYEFVSDRDTLEEHSNKKSEEETFAYWKKKNLVSIDGIETGLLD